MRKLLMTLFAAVIVAAAVCLCGCSVSYTNYLYQDSDKYTAGDREIPDKIETINIDYLSGKVKLTGTDSETVKIRETANETLDDDRKVHTWVSGTTLYVRYCASAKRLDLYKLEKTLEIDIPENVKLSELKIEISSGDADCSKFEAKSVEMKASSGDLFASCKAETIEMKASSGDITLTQTGESDKISLETSSGSITVLTEKVGKLDVDSSSGKISVASDGAKVFKSHSSSGKGEFKFAEVPETAEMEASSGDITVYLPEDANVTAEFDVSSGDITYELPFSKSGGKYVSGDGSRKLTVETSSGDITVKKLQ